MPPRRYLKIFSFFVLLNLALSQSGFALLPEDCRRSHRRLGSGNSPEEQRLLDYRTRNPKSLHKLSTAEENRRYLKLISQLHPNNKMKFFAVDLQPLRDLNSGDLLAGKEYVDAARNLMRDILIRKIHETPVLKKYLVEQFVDFKSMEFAFSEVAAAEETAFRGHLNGIFRDAQVEFDQQMRDSLAPTPEAMQRFLTQMGLVSNPREWHSGALAVGHPNYATYQVRDKEFNPERENISVAIFNPEKAGITLETAERNRMRLQLTFGGTTLMTPYQNTSDFVLSKATLDVLRKTKNVPAKERLEKVREGIFERLKLKLTLDQTKALVEYQDAFNKFSPPVRAEEPVVFDFSKAPHGIVTVDFAGQGFVNAEHTMGALIEASKSDISSLNAIRTAAKYDQKATARLNSMRERFQKALNRAGIKAKARFTGDDGAALLEEPITPAQHQALLRYLSEEPDCGDFRTVYSPPVGRPVTMKEHTDAEQVEKNLKGKLRIHFSDAVADSVGIGSSINPVTGKIQLTVQGKVPDHVMNFLRTEAASPENLGAFRLEGGLQRVGYGIPPQ